MLPPEERNFPIDLGPARISICLVSFCATRIRVILEGQNKEIVHYEIPVIKNTILLLGSSPNVRQRAPIAKNLPSHTEGFGEESLKSSNFDMPHMHSSRGQQLSPERALLSSPNNSKQSDTFQQDRNTNLFRSQKGW